MHDNPSVFTRNYCLLYRVPGAGTCRGCVLMASYPKPVNVALRTYP
jgi:hypothetical protein